MAPLIRFTVKEKALSDRLSKIGFELVDLMMRKTQPFLFFEKDGKRIQVLRSELNEEFVSSLEKTHSKKTKAKKTKKKAVKKSKSKNSLTTKKNDDILVDKSLEPESGVVLEPSEAKRIDEEYIKTHWS